MKASKKKHVCHLKDVAQKHWSRGWIDFYKTEKKYYLDSFVREYHAYMDI